MLKRKLILFLVISLTFSLPAFSQDDEGLIDLIETSPLFPGGEDSLWCFIESHLDFKILNTHVKQGKIMASFTVDTEGKVINCETNSVSFQRFDWYMKDTLIENEIVRVLNLLPDWTPGDLRGHPIKVKYTLPLKIPYIEPKCKNFNNSTFVYLYQKVDQPAIFHFGSEMETQPSIQKYIEQNMLWPSDDDCFGNVYIRTIIDEKGKLSDFTIIRGLDSCRGFNDEALRLVRSMPPWSPAILEGKPVKSYIVIPISFRIR
ncbi:MAG: energy transducer TonB [Bacteroidales bacterium]|jgi:hypothetical protein|nr:energy transducer TonB [Bacteroidales bacterium]